MKKLSILLCVVLLSGCGSLNTLKFWGNDSDEDEVSTEPLALVDFDAVSELRKVWSNNAVGNLEQGVGSLKPAIGNGAIYAADASGNVVAMHQVTGKTLWKQDLKTQLTGGVGYGGHQVLVGNVKGQLYVLSADTGAVLWSTNASSEILSAPASNGSVVVVQTTNGKLQAYDAESGLERWEFDVDVPILTMRGTSSPIVTDTMVLAAFSNGKLYAMNAESGTVMWESRVAVSRGRTELERIIDIDGDLLLKEDVIYAASYQGRLGAFARGTGRALWYQDVSTTEGPGYSLSQTYVTDENDKVIAYSANNGQEIWTNDQMLYRDLTSPMPLERYLAVADSDGYLHILSQVDGSFVARTKVDGSGVSAPMLSADDLLYVLDNGGGVTAYRVE